jgi:transcriptional regulator GlxA family with amidase domain
MEEADATWEAIDDFKTRFPNFQLEDELFVEGGRDVMVGKFYQRRGRTSG